MTANAFLDGGSHPGQQEKKAHATDKPASNPDSIVFSWISEAAVCHPCASLSQWCAAWMQGQVYHSILLVRHAAPAKGTAIVAVKLGGLTGENSWWGSPGVHKDWVNQAFWPTPKISIWCDDTDVALIFGRFVEVWIGFSPYVSEPDAKGLITCLYLPSFFFKSCYFKKQFPKIVRRATPQKKTYLLATRCFFACRCFINHWGYKNSAGKYWTTTPFDLSDLHQISTWSTGDATNKPTTKPLLRGMHHDVSQPHGVFDAFGQVCLAESSIQVREPSGSKSGWLWLWGVWLYNWENWPGFGQQFDLTIKRIAFCCYIWPWATGERPLRVEGWRRRATRQLGEVPEFLN